MSNSGKFDRSPSTPLLEENHEAPNQHGLSSPTSAAPGRHEGAPNYSFNSDGHLTINGESTDVISEDLIKTPVIFEIPIGFDIISCVVDFAKHFGLSVTVLIGHGLITDVDIEYPRGAIPPPCVSTSFHIISFSGTYRCLDPDSGEIISYFHVQFADGANNVMGGRVLSHMKAASAVTLILAVEEV